jgi:hypothetical protein
MLCRQPLDLIEASRSSSTFAVHADLECDIGLAPDSLDPGTGCCAGPRRISAASLGPLKAAPDLQERSAVVHATEQIQVGVQLRVGDLGQVGDPCRRISQRNSGLLRMRR